MSLEEVKALCDEYGVEGEADVRRFCDAIYAHDGDAKAAAQDMGLAAVSGVAATSDEMKTAGAASAAAGVEGLESVDAEPSGENFTLGYANGIIAERVVSAVRSNAASLATQAIAAVNNAQISQSPSKVMKKVGRWFGEGYALGIESERDRVADASSSLVDAAEGAFREIDWYSTSGAWGTPQALWGGSAAVPAMSQPGVSVNVQRGDETALLMRMVEVLDSIRDGIPSGVYLDRRQLVGALASDIDVRIGANQAESRRGY